MFALLGLVAVFSLVSAQGPNKSDKLISQSKAKFDGLKDLRATFVYTLNNPNLQKPIVKNGKVDFKNGKYKVVFPSETIFCNGASMWLMLPDDEEITITEVTEETISVDKIYEIYESDSKSRYDGVEGSNEKVTLFAESKENDIWKTEIWINKNNKLISKAIMHARNGSTYTYSMKDIETNLGLSDALFSLNHAKYESDGWIVTDLR